MLCLSGFGASEQLNEQKTRRKREQIGHDANSNLLSSHPKGAYINSASVRRRIELIVQNVHEHRDAQENKAARDSVQTGERALNRSGKDRKPQFFAFRRLSAISGLLDHRLFPLPATFRTKNSPSTPIRNESIPPRLNTFLFLSIKCLGSVSPPSPLKIKLTLESVAAFCLLPVNTITS
ncbi:hypothetical protein BpHYR1_016429 [Brachionus plicatilis]|uniref:Uncharacterized protein n=1 Tax=Brachionus plicatilis TaxID=10195 RepID=A0A3M7RPJ0_BRAPC|nr:hypothetical protein BpHYR1_016429 [Brachionus plicatilis]